MSAGAGQPSVRTVPSWPGPVNALSAAKVFSAKFKLRIARLRVVSIGQEEEEAMMRNDVLCKHCGYPLTYHTGDDLKQACYEALLAQYTWQQIATAPKNGDWVMLWVPEVWGVHRAYTTTGSWGDVEDYGVCWISAATGRPLNPTHWMPLIAP